MRKGNRIYAIIAVLLLSLGACSLIHDDMEELGYREDGSAYAYVSLTIHTGTTGNVTRANPTGGEDGNGNEKGQDYENRVNNLTLFFYPATLEDGGVNRTENVDFTAKVYITNPDPNWNMTDGDQPIDKTFEVGPVKVNGLKMNQQYHVLAVANAGDQTDIASLEALRSETVSTVYTATTTDNKTSYSNFVMASEGDENPVLEISYENSETNPAETTINLERLVARVDYKTNDKNEYQLSSSLVTPGLNPAQSSPAQQVTAGVSSRADAQVTASITRAFLVNTYKQDTYVLKRVAEGNVNGTITYLGDESLSNYVIDPKTTSKSIPVPEDKNIPSWYDHYFPSLNDGNSEEWEKWLIVGDEVKDPDTQEAWLRLGYPKENTSSIDAQGKYYSTGVVFEAEYNLGTGFTTGKTFFLVNGTTIFFTLEEAMKAHNDSFFDKDRRFSSSAHPYAELQAYMGVLEDNDPAGYKAFLQTAKETDTDWTVYEWASYKTYQLGYDTKGNPTAETRKALHERVTGPNKTETFLNGRGYYTYWIRHNYGGEQEESGLPMENAIVRNNIYKLTVNSISEIGNDVPGDKTLDILVAVAKWNLLDEENIDLEPTN